MIKKFFTTDISTKLISLAFSIFLWVYLVVLLNPKIEVTIPNVPLTYSDHTVLTQKGYVITNDTTDSVTLKLKGTRNMLAHINKNNISAYIDLSGCSQEGTFSLPVHVRLPYDEITIADKSPYTVAVVVDRVIEESIPLQTVTQGEPKSGYSIGTINPDYKNITIKGASQYVKSISKAVLSINVDGKKENIIDKGNITLYNSRNEIVSNNFIAPVPKTVGYYVEVLEDKTVDINTASLAIPQGYVMSGIDPAKITISGNSELLNNITSVKVTEIEYSDEIAGTYEVKPVLPDGVSSKENKILITIKKEDTND